MNQNKILERPNMPNLVKKYIKQYVVQMLEVKITGKILVSDPERKI